MKRLIIKVLFLSFICMCFCSCGGDTGGIYTTSVSFSDGTEDDVIGFDAIQDICKAATPTTPADYETFTDVVANITLTVGEGMPGVTINSYSLEYDPLTSVAADNSTATPPSFPSLTGETGNGSNNIHVDSDSSAEFSITCFSTSQKTAFVNNWPGTYTARYTVRIVLHCTDDSGYDRDIEIRRTVYISNYDNC